LLIKTELVQSNTSCRLHRWVEGTMSHFDISAEVHQSALRSDWAVCMNVSLRTVCGNSMVRSLHREQLAHLTRLVELIRTLRCPRHCHPYRYRCCYHCRFRLIQLKLVTADMRTAVLPVKPQVVLESKLKLDEAMTSRANHSVQL